jgi:hypothetical protein
VKRYLLFAGGCYYPEGGWGDYRGDFDSLGDAHSAAVRVCRKGYDKFDWNTSFWWHVVDAETRELVPGSKRLVDCYGRGDLRVCALGEQGYRSEFVPLEELETVR